MYCLAKIVHPFESRQAPNEYSLFYDLVVAHSGERIILDQKDMYDFDLLQVYGIPSRDS